jgi:2-polyprenyl-6-methoxyphenol hydroxylase-like FAD-dependent oxidoreductase
MWGLVESYRSLGVASNYRWDSHFCTSLGPGGKKFSAWVRLQLPDHLIRSITNCPVHFQELPSVDEWRKAISENNDGSHPAEPGQRCSQIIFEAWMKDKCLQQKLIDGHFGLTFVSATEDDEGVTSHLMDKEGRAHVVRSQYLVGADGGGSTVRKSAGIKMIGGPM